LTDISLREPAALTDRVETARRAGAGDFRFRLMALGAAITVLLIFAGVIASLVIGAMPAFKAFGFSFITVEAWRPTRDYFGALASIYGTLITSLIAMLIAVPVGLFAAIYLAEYADRRLRVVAKPFLELLADSPFEVRQRLLAREPYPGRPDGTTNLWIVTWK